MCVHAHSFAKLAPSSRSSRMQPTTPTDPFSFHHSYLVSPFPLLPFTGQWTRRREGGRKEKRPKEQYKIESADRLHEDQTSQKVLTFFPGGFFVEGTCLMGSRIETRNFISGIVFAVWDRLESEKKNYCVYKSINFA